MILGASISARVNCHGLVQFGPAVDSKEGGPEDIGRCCGSGDCGPAEVLVRRVGRIVATIGECAVVDDISSNERRVRRCRMRFADCSWSKVTAEDDQG